MATPKRLAGPAHLSNSAANIVSPTSGITKVIRQIHLVNKTAGAVTVTLYVGATGGSASGTEVLEAKSIAAHDYLPLYFTPGLVLADTEYLTGLASAASSIAATVMGESIVP